MATGIITIGLVVEDVAIMVVVTTMDEVGVVGDASTIVVPITRTKGTQIIATLEVVEIEEVDVVVTEVVATIAVDAIRVLVAATLVEVDVIASMDNRQSLLEQLLQMHRSI